MKRTIFVELLETINVYKELAIAGRRVTHINEDMLVHMCYAEFDCGYLDRAQLRTLLERI